MKIVPVFNMKGGVAKTTSSVMLAEALAEFCGYRVLIVDADPQFNATRMLLTSKVIEAATNVSHSKTVARYLLKCVTETNIPCPKEFVLPRAGTVHGTGQVDLLAGTFRTGEVADTMLLASANPGRNLESVLQRAALGLKELNEAGPYDLIIVDCPPGLTMPVRAALRAADLLIVPTTADDTAHAGIATLVWSLKKLSEVEHALIEKRRVLITRYESQSEYNLKTLKRDEATFESCVTKRQSILVARLFSPETPCTFKGKYGAATEKELKKIVSELTVLLGLVRPGATVIAPMPKEKMNVKRKPNRGELPLGATANSGGTSRANKETNYSDLSSFSKRGS
jgi:chromosome partitioning protein